ncbi:Retrovirus-related Pol polyprotein from transposon TNT 1-94-like protein [Drosera capensis]
MSPLPSNEEHNVRRNEVIEIGDDEVDIDRDDQEEMPPADPAPRRSTREPQPLTRYSSSRGVGREGFAVRGKENLVCRLRKSLYGLKQVPRQWYKKFDLFMGEHGYNHIASDHCVYVKRFSYDDFIILLLYVDDMLIVGKDTNKICKLKRELSKSFAIKDLGPAKQILGMKISRDRSTRKLWLSQKSYV